MPKTNHEKWLSDGVEYSGQTETITFCECLQDILKGMRKEGCSEEEIREHLLAVADQFIDVATVFKKEFGDSSLSKDVKVRMVIDLEGGLVQGVYTDNPEVEVQAIVADYDIDGADEEDLLTVPEGVSDEDGRQFSAGSQEPGTAPKYVSGVFDMVKALEKKWKDDAAYAAPCGSRLDCNSCGAAIDGEGCDAFPGEV